MSRVNQRTRRVSVHVLRAVSLVRVTVDTVGCHPSNKTKNGGVGFLHFLAFSCRCRTRLAGAARGDGQAPQGRGHRRTIVQVQVFGAWFDLNDARRICPIEQAVRVRVRVRVSNPNPSPNPNPNQEWAPIARRALVPRPVAAAGRSAVRFRTVLALFGQWCRGKLALALGRLPPPLRRLLAAAVLRASGTAAPSAS